VNSSDDNDMEFQKILRTNFVKYNINKYDEFFQALDTGDLKLAHRIVHTLKSNAGQLGKQRLQKISADIEELLKGIIKDNLNKNLVTGDHLNIFETELAAVLKEFTPLLSEPALPPGVDVSHFNKDKILEVIKELEPLVKGGRPKSLGYIDTLRAISGSKNLVNQKIIPLINQLINQMDNFEFETAFVTLSEILDGINEHDK
jgi:HPt (histidine-containing phosphotransfer) domain-containing protein